jgi:hypothetical protein
MKMTSTIFTERLQECETMGQSYSLFKETPIDILEAFVSAGEQATAMGYQFTMRDNFLLGDAKIRLNILKEGQERENDWL